MDAKPLFILIIFVLVLMVIAGGIVGDVNLTDSGRTQTLSNNPSAGNFGVFADSSSSSLSSSSSGVGQPVTGKSTSAQNSPCGSSYTVKKGDTLSQIARTCLISIEDMLAVNTSITNPNLITEGQKITIFVVLPAAHPTSRLPIVPTQKAQTSATPAPNLKPGGLVNVEMKGFPPGAQIQVAIGKVGSIPINYKNVKADSNGVVKISVPIPTTANANEKWTVTMITVNTPKMRVTAVPFTIK
jgi:LysM repeat protein